MMIGRIEYRDSIITLPHAVDGISAVHNPDQLFRSRRRRSCRSSLDSPPYLTTNFRRNFVSKYPSAASL